MPLTFNGYIPTDLAIPAGDWNRESHTTDEIDVVADPLGSGLQVGRLILRSGDAQIAGGYRTEISPVSGSRQAIEAEYWYYTAIYIPPTTVIPPGEKATIMQWHDAGSEPPMWFFELTDDGALHLSQNVITLPSTGTASYQKRRIAGARGRWQEIVVRVFWSIDPQLGRVQIWHDGRELLTYRGVTTYDVVGNNYFKTGIYWGDTSLPANGEWAIYTAGLIVGTGYTSFDGFMSACGLSARQRMPMPLAGRKPAAWIDLKNNIAMASKLELSGQTSVAFLAIVANRMTAAQQVIIGDNNTSFELAVRASNQTSPNSIRLEFKDTLAGNHRGNNYNAFGVTQQLNDALLWRYIAADCDFATGAMRFWIDGEPQNAIEYQDAQAAFSIAAAGATTYIGGRNGSRQFGGSLAGVWVYRSKLFTNAEIARWWGQNVAPSDPYVYYKFDEASGNLIDYGSAGLNATWGSGSRWYSPRPAAHAIRASTTLTVRSVRTGNPTVR